MIVDLDDDNLKRYWPKAFQYWPLLRNNTLIQGLPYLEEEAEQVVNMICLSLFSKLPRSHQFKKQERATVTRRKAIST
jgi:hypothetical protein